MATQKRRVIYMTDEMWATCGRQAEAAGLTISDWLRGLVTEDAFERQETRRRPEVVGPARAHLEAVLMDRRIEFRPVPKPGKGK